jgi:hypothetical protein
MFVRYMTLEVRRSECQEDQIEYPDEDFWIGQSFEPERGTCSLANGMSGEAYSSRSVERTHRRDG